jgi:GT2 family glycosyltransferase/glycosyltransferase involved in cell wall biosynthesis
MKMLLWPIKCLCVIFLWVIAVVITLVFLANELFYILLLSWLRFFTKKGCSGARPSPKASIIILNWNGKNLLAEYLPSVIEAVKYEGGDHEIIVVDNGSTDGSVEFLQEHFPQVRIVALEKNYYFTGGNNAGALAAKNDILVFLNNDMYVEKDFLRPLLEGFFDESVFAVSAQIFFHDPNKRREETGKTRAEWRWGFIDFRHDLPTDGDLRNRYVPAFWLGGGSAAVDRRKFLEICGFDTLMNPFYVEDTDLSYQAWKRGWKVLFCPESKGIHKHRASTGRYNRVYVERTIRRNQLLFIWKNITDFRMLLSHLALLPLTLWRMRRQIGAMETAKAFLEAVTKLPEVLYKRNKCRLYYCRSDRDVFKLANSTFEYKQQFVPPRLIKPGDKLRILFVCPYLPSPLHGGGVRMLQMIRRLSEKHEVSVLSFSDNEEERRYIPELQKFCKEVRVIARRPYLPGIDWLRRLPANVAIDFGDPAMSHALRQMLGDNDYDVVQCEYIQMAHQIPRLRREVIILTEHEVQHAAIFRLLKHERNYLKKLFIVLKWLKWLNAEINLCRKFDKIITLTQDDALALKRFDPSLPIEVIETCTDIEYFYPLEAIEEPNTLIYTGNFRHLPNVDAALYLINEILPKVRQEIPDIRLYLVGAWPTPEIQELAQKNGVVATGWVEDMRPYLSRASLFVAPIRLGVGIRGKILEAWAMRKAVVATPIACAGLKAKHGEHLWVAEDTEGFVKGIVTLLRDVDLRRRLGWNGRRLVEEKYNWEVAVAKQIQVYIDVLKSKGRFF